MELNRQRQRAILNLLKTAFPGSIDNVQLPESLRGNQAHEIRGELVYLKQHGLLDFETHSSWTEDASPFYNIRITAGGLDFLADDGGLAAILGVVTIRLHDDTIKALLEVKIAKSELPDAEKAGLIGKVRSLTAAGVRRLANKLVELGIDKLAEHVEDVLAAIDQAM